MSAQLKVGVIGLGEVGRHHVAGVLAAEAATLAAVADFDPKLVAANTAATGARGHADGAALIADPEVEAVVVCVPHKFHAEIAGQALAAGKHVLLEKPMAVSVAECDALIAAARKADRVLAVSHNQLFYPAHRWLHDEIAAGRLSQPSMLRLRLAIGGKYGGWRADPDLTGGGLLFDAGFHRFYLARFLMGEVSAVTAVLDTPDPRGVGESHAIVTLEFTRGGRAVIDAGYLGPKGAFDDQVEAVCPEALVRLPGVEAHFEKFSDEAPVLSWRDGRWTAHEVEPLDWSGTVGRSAENFVGAALGRTTPAVDGAEGRRIVELVEAAYRSATEGRRIPV